MMEWPNCLTAAQNVLMKSLNDVRCQTKKKVVKLKRKETPEQVCFNFNPLGLNLNPKIEFLIKISGLMTLRNII